MKFCKHIILLYFIFLSVSSFGLNYIDSLKTVLNNKKITDKVRVQTLGDIAWEYCYTNLDSAEIFAQMELRLAKKNKFHFKIGDALNTLGTLKRIKGDYRSALDFYQQSLKIYLDLKDTFSLGAINNNLGAIYQYQENYALALQYHEKGLKYYSVGNNKEGIANSVINLGLCQAALKQFDIAEKYFLQAIKIYEELNDIGGLVNAHLNMGGMYWSQKKYLEAEMAFEKSIEYGKNTNDDYTNNTVLCNIGQVKIFASKYQEGLKLCHKTYEIALKRGWIDILMMSCDCLYQGYKNTGNSTKALQYFEKFKVYKDSTRNRELNSDIAMKEAQFEYALKFTQDSIENVQVKKINAAELAKADAELGKKQFQQYVLYGGLFVVLIFALFIYNRFRLTQKQKNIIEEKEKETQVQKHIIEEKQKEIIDSINYAQRLQQAILVNKIEIDKHFKENFLLYKPKDIVAGDFYFFEKTDTHIFYAAADCTGHGVPGAMMSIVCANALLRCVKEFKLNDPGKILDKTRDLVVETFEKSGQDVKDGMDISLCVFSIESLKKNEFSNGDNLNLKWSGANNPLWYIENGKMKEIKPDKQPVGKIENPKSFTTHSISLLPNTTLFLLTDGYADQFGGPKGKKFKFSNLQELILKNNHLKMDEQLKVLNEAFENWRGELEQVDDVCIIGVKV